jgi:hypothetical protein
MWFRSASTAHVYARRLVLVLCEGYSLAPSVAQRSLEPVGRYTYIFTHTYPQPSGCNAAEVRPYGDYVRHECVRMRLMARGEGYASSRFLSAEEKAPAGAAAINQGSLDRVSVIVCAEDKGCRKDVLYFLPELSLVFPGQCPWQGAFAEAYRVFGAWIHVPRLGEGRPGRLDRPRRWICVGSPRGWSHAETGGTHQGLRVGGPGPGTHFGQDDGGTAGHWLDGNSRQSPPSRGGGVGPLGRHREGRRPG